MGSVLQTHLEVLLGQVEALLGLTNQDKANLAEFLKSLPGGKNGLILSGAVLDGNICTETAPPRI
jgi:hypothetical protein